MPDGPAGGSGSRPGEAAVAGRLSMLLEELARAPGEDLHRAWQERLRPGDVVGRFEILREIGRGGFGVVHEALDQQLGRSVAFKTLRPARTSHELSADWIRKEAEAVARLDHPAIVTLHEVGTCASGPYLVEELLRGETLEERLRGGPLPVREAVAVGLQIARGLAHAHGRGVLHRDLKPGNVFLTEDGRVKLLDFGLAHLLGTRGVHGAGTLAYMAPEQLRGEVVDARADVFALGATLFEALTGKAPFEVREGRSAALDGAPPPALPEGTAAPLAGLLERCLSLDLARRPASGQAAVEELLAVQRELDRPVLGGRTSVGTLPASRGLRLVVLLAGIAGIIAGGAYLAATRGRSTTELRRAATVSPAPPSVAVLPFADMSPGKDQEHFSDGIAEEIINALTRVEGLQVVGRTSSFSFKGRTDDLREVGRKLGAGAVLEGSVRTAGSKVRITAQLVNAANGYHLWSETFDRELGDVLALEDEIAQAVVNALRLRLASGPAPAPRARRVVAPEAYTVYLLGKQLLRRYNVSDFERARKAFEEAIALDPGYAPAWAALAEATYWSSDYLPKLADIREGFERAMAAADRALALDPELAQGYATRGFLRAGARWDWAGALDDFERALRLNPGDAQVHRLYSHIVLRPLGRFPEAIAEARRATELDPLDANAWSTLAAACYGDGQLERALDAYDRSLVIQPEQDYATSRKAMLLVSLGRPAEALTWAERSTSPVTRSWAIAIAAHSLGRAEESRRALERLVSDHSEGAAYQVAWVYAMRGERDKAFEWLQRAYEQHDSGLLFAKTDPGLWGLHGDPRFAALVRKVGLPVP